MRTKQTCRHHVKLRSAGVCMLGRDEPLTRQDVWDAVEWAVWGLVGMFALTMLIGVKL